MSDRYYTPDYIIEYVARQMGVAESEALVGSEDATRLPNVEPEEWTDYKGD